MVQVYSLVSSAKRHSPDFTQLLPVHRTRSFISHLNSPGSIQPSCHFFRRTELFKHTSRHCPTRYPLTPGSRECTCEESALPRSTSSEHNYSAQPGIEPTISRLYVAHATTEPRHPTQFSNELGPEGLTGSWANKYRHVPYQGHFYTSVSLAIPWSLQPTGGSTRLAKRRPMFCLVVGSMVIPRTFHLGHTKLTHNLQQHVLRHLGLFACQPYPHSHPLEILMKSKRSRVLHLGCQAA